MPDKNVCSYYKILCGEARMSYLVEKHKHEVSRERPNTLITSSHTVQSPLITYS